MYQMCRWKSIHTTLVIMNSKDGIVIFIGSISRIDTTFLTINWKDGIVWLFIFRCFLLISSAGFRGWSFELSQIGSFTSTFILLRTSAWLIGSICIMHFTGLVQGPVLVFMNLSPFFFVIVIKEHYTFIFSDSAVYLLIFRSCFIILFRVVIMLWTDASLIIIKQQRNAITSNPVKL